MKNILAHILQFLKDHCFGIFLLLYLPGWLTVLVIRRYIFPRIS